MKSTPLAKILAAITFVALGGGFLALPFTLQKAENVSVRNKALKDAVIFDTAPAATAARARVLKLQPHDERLRGFVNRLDNSLSDQIDEWTGWESWRQDPAVDPSAKAKRETEHQDKMAKIAQAIQGVKQDLTDWRPDPFEKK